MRFFLDCEFNERGPDYPLVLISIGIVAEDGREMYYESAEFEEKDCDEWLCDNVLPHLYKSGPLVPRSGILHKVQTFIGADPNPRFWGYYCAYDWVLLCQLFGDMEGLPLHWNECCYDLRQALDMRGLVGIYQPDTHLHHALEDARWIRDTWKVYVNQ